MTKHKHHHKKADKWTNIGSIGELIASASSNFYWGVSLANLAYASPEEDASGISSYVGAALALMAFGAMYAHRKLNIYHQHDDIEHKNNEKSAEHPAETQTEQLISEEKDFEEQDTEHSHVHLTQLQKIALAADLITHTGDVSGAIVAGADLIAKTVVKHSLPQWGRALVQCGATLFGYSSAVANVRSCRHAIVEQNEQEASHKNPAARLV
ncbi:MAG: hypothetical protein ACD_45C00690G0006 [uncultured bacterium]|nr:MAG: hypothetical protein ACD_45C00690G0006 [uncultured bacterium]